MDCEVLYEVPLMLAEQNIDELICKHFGLETQPLDLTMWVKMVEGIKGLKEKVRIALVGKYVALKDAYLSVYEALKHAGYANGVDVVTEAIDSGK